MPFEFFDTDITGAFIIKPTIFRDSRGFFSEFYKKSVFKQMGLDVEFVQDNIATSVKNVLRGLHMQLPPKAQAKLITCLKGKILDIGVDLRQNSTTCGKWIAVEISSENPCFVYLPEGFAHGYLVLSDSADVFYKCSAEYAPECEVGILWNDPDIKINWGIDSPILSDKDRLNKFLRELNLTVF